MVSKAFWWFTCTLCVGVILSLLAPHVSPALWWGFPILGLTYPLGLILLIGVTVYWVSSKQKRALLPVLVLLAAVLYVPRYLNVNSPSSAESSISVGTYNLSNAIAGYDRQKAVRESKRQRLEDFLHTLRPIDILCVQEKGAFASEVLASVFNEHHQHSDKHKGAAILSRYPILKKGIIDFGTVTNSCLWADLAIGDQVVRVYSTHLQSNGITVDTKRIIEGEAPVQSKAQRRWRRVVSNFLDAHSKRVVQARRIKEHMSDCPHPIIVGGDFNDVPMSRTYQIFADDFKDSFVQKGSGIASTFAGHIPFLRIDYIWSSPDIEVISHNVISNAAYSDHYPVVVEMTF